VREVIETCRSLTAHPKPAVEQPRREADAAILAASAQAIRSELGWQPRYTLRDIVERAWRWMQSHPRGYSGDG
jgi:UDP-glucose 4-epimerase